MTLHQVNIFPGGHGRGLQSEAAPLGINVLQDAHAQSRQRLEDLLPLFQSSPLKPWLSSVKSLLQESDPRIFYQDLLELADELDRNGHTKEAFPFWEEVGHQSCASELAKSARQNMELAAGGGPMGERVERQLAALPDQILDGPTLAGMLVGGVAYRLSRGALLKWLVPAGSRIGLPQWLAARGAASLGGLAVEAPLFTGVTHALKPQEGFEARSAITHAALTLGCLRTFGFAAQSLGKIPVLANRLGPQGAAVLGNLGMFGGIAAAESLSRDWKLHPLGDPLPLGLQTFITWAQFKGAGAFYHRLAPESLKSWEQNQDLKLEFRPGSLPLHRLGPQLVWIQGDSSGRSPLESNGSLSWIYSNDPYENTGYLSTSIRPPTESPESRPPLSDHQVRTFLGAAERFSRHALGYIKIIQDALEIPNYGFVRTIAGTSVSDWQQWETGLFRLYHLVKTSQPHGPKGGYLNWITRLALDPISRQQDSAKLDQILKALNEGGSIQDYEQILAQVLPASKPAPWGKTTSYYFKRLVSETFRGPQIDANAYEPFMAPLTLKEIHRLQVDLSTKARIIRVLAMPEGLPFPAETLPPALRFVLMHPALRSQVEKIFQNLEDSPLADFRLLRLLHVARAGGDLMASRIGELADSNLRLLGDPYPIEVPEAEAMSGTQWDAYLGPELDTALIRQIHQELPKLLDPKRSAIRWEDTKRKMRHFAANLKERFTLNPLKLSIILEKVPEARAVETSRLFQKEGTEQMVPITLAEAIKTLRERPYSSLPLVAKYLFEPRAGKGEKLLTHEMLGRAFHKAYKRSDEVALYYIGQAFFEASRREKVHAIAQTFLEFGDPIALEVAEAIFSERILFQLENDKHYDRLINKFPDPQQHRKASNAMYFAPGRLGPKPVMLVRMSPGMPFKNASPEATLFEVFGNIVHEFRHFKEFDRERGHEPGIMLLWETNAHLWEYRWRAQHGNTRYLNEFSEMGPTGFALTFRSMFEEWYPNHIKEHPALPALPGSQDQAGTQ